MRHHYLGQSLAEYGIIIALVAIVGLAGLMLLGQSIQGELANIMNNQSSLPSTSTSPPGANTVTALTATPSTSTSADSGTVANSPASNMAQPPTATHEPTPQAAGAIGSSEKVLASMNTLEQVAQTYKDTNPELYNVLVKLAQKGREVAQGITNYSGSGVDMGLFATTGEFYTIWTDEVQGSVLYSQLSAEDQQLVKNLTENSAYLAQTTLGGSGDAGAMLTGMNASATVNSNADQTQACADGKC